MTQQDNGDELAEEQRRCHPNVDLDALAEVLADVDARLATDSAPPLDVDVQAIAEVWADMDERICAERGITLEQLQAEDEEERNRS